MAGRGERESTRTAGYIAFGRTPSLKSHELGEESAWCHRDLVSLLETKQHAA